MHGVLSFTFLSVLFLVSDEPLHDVSRYISYLILNIARSELLLNCSGGTSHSVVHNSLVKSH